MERSTFEARTNPHSRTNFRSLTREELTIRAKQLSALHAKTSRKVAKLQAKLFDAVESQGHTLDDQTESDLQSIIKHHNAAVTSKHAPGSFARVFWEQQQKAAQQKDARGMRWHPLMIKWAIYLHYRSSGAYSTIRSSGVLSLPSERTLRDFTHHCNAQVGFSFEVDQQLVNHPDVCGVEEWKRHVILLFDEMHIREDLVYNKHTGALVGFVELGEVNNQLQQFERSLDRKGEPPSPPPLAKTMFVIMVKGLFTKLQFPYAAFTCNNLTGDKISPLFWEAVYRVERCGLKVVGATFDGAAPNRRFLQLQYPCSEPDGLILYKVNNPYTDEKRKIFFFSDPSHLIKTVRNCWASPARRMWVSV